MGADLGDNFLPPDRHNKGGYWEDAEIQALNIEMLQATKCEWHHLASISENNVATLRTLGYQTRAREILRRKIGTAHVVGLKDPRITKLLPFWKEVFKTCDVEISYVLVIRNPLSVIQSLEKRDKLDPVHSLYLWLEYNIAALANGIGGLDAIVDYDRLVQSPTKAVAILAKRLNLPTDSTEMAAFENEFLNHKNRHSVYNLDDLVQDSLCPNLICKIYASMLSASASDGRLSYSHLEEEISLWSAELDRMQPLFHHIDSLFRQIEISRQIGIGSEHPTIVASLYNIARSIFRQLPFSNWLRSKFRR
jgi:hypothetical protein